MALTPWLVCLSIAVSIANEAEAPLRFELTAQWSLAGEGDASFGGVPFVCDVDCDGASEVLWLQSPGLFHSKVFDAPAGETRFLDAERNHWCLTVTESDGALRWQLGEPWRGARPFVSHSAERAIDCADIDGDGAIEAVCVRRAELIVLDAASGAVERTTALPADNGQIVRLGHTGARAGEWKILVQNSERAYPPHEYGNPTWFYSPRLELLATADYLGAGHAPLAADVDGDGLDEFVIGFNLVDHDLRRVWQFAPVPPEQWNAGDMHVDGVDLGVIDGQPCLAYAASDQAYLVEARTGALIWQRRSTHPQHCRIGHFLPETPGNQVFVHNKRAELQLFDAKGTERWRMMPPAHFPLGAAAPCKRQQFHMFDPLMPLRKLGPDDTDMCIFTDNGWPYVVDGLGHRCAEFPPPPAAAQDWGEVPGRPDDYGYGYYARVADFDGDDAQEVLLSDRRFAWIFEILRAPR